MRHLARCEIEAGLAHVRRSADDRGRLELIVRRTAPGERETIEEGELDVEQGLIGDRWWQVRNSQPGHGSDPGAMLQVVTGRRQVAVMNARFSHLVAGAPERVPIGGDQFHVDLDLSVANIPVGGRIRIGEALLEVSPKPHTGCKQFAARFGADALAVVRSPAGRELRLRGLYARVIEGGLIRKGDLVVVER